MGLRTNGRWLGCGGEESEAIEGTDIIGKTYARIQDIGSISRQANRPNGAQFWYSSLTLVS
jgi:hypothetical protein